MSSSAAFNVPLIENQCLLWWMPMVKVEFGRHCSQISDGEALACIRRRRTYIKPAKHDVVTLICAAFLGCFVDRGSGSRSWNDVAKK